METTVNFVTPAALLPVAHTSDIQMLKLTYFMVLLFMFLYVLAVISATTFSHTFSGI
jgi:hypothetical protein